MENTKTKVAERCAGRGEPWNWISNCLFLDYIHNDTSNPIMSHALQIPPPLFPFTLTHLFATYNFTDYDMSRTHSFENIFVSSFRLVCG